MQKLDLFPSGKLDVTLSRLCHQLIENYPSFENTVILGIQTSGVTLAKRIVNVLESLVPDSGVQYGDLDVTFFRDDFRRRESVIQPNQTNIDFLIEGKRVILVDDVLYTGRTIRAAMDAMLAYGRPHSVELLVLVNRKHSRELPVEPTYIGIDVDTIESEHVFVELREGGGKDKVYLQPEKND